MIHLGTTTIETPRLILRQFKLSDRDNMFNNWASNNNVTHFLTWPTHSSPAVTENVLGFWINQYENHEYYHWCIELKQTNQAIGSMGVVSLENNIDSAEIGYCIGEDYWNQGLTTEALKAVITFLFKEVDCKRISACHDVNNPNSGKVMLKSGFIHEGTLRQAARNNTGICDLDVYSILRKDFFV